MGTYHIFPIGVYVPAFDKKPVGGNEDGKSEEESQHQAENFYLQNENAPKKFIFRILPA
jgi:hypothetical protein